MGTRRARVRRRDALPGGRNEHRDPGRRRPERPGPADAPARPRDPLLQRGRRVPPSLRVRSGWVASGRPALRSRPPVEGRAAAGRGVGRLARRRRGVHGARVRRPRAAPAVARTHRVAAPRLGPRASRGRHRRLPASSPFPGPRLGMRRRAQRDRSRGIPRSGRGASPEEAPLRELAPGAPPPGLSLVTDRVLHRGPASQLVPDAGLSDRLLLRLFAGRLHDERWLSRSVGADGRSPAGWIVHETVRR